VLSIQLEIHHVLERYSKRTRILEAQDTAMKARLDLCTARIEAVGRLLLVGFNFSASNEVYLIQEESNAIVKDADAVTAAAVQAKAAIDWEVRVYVAVVAQLYAALWARNAEVDNTPKSRLAARAFRSFANSVCHVVDA
jgi:hypothetical protein